MARILIIEDEESVATSLEGALSSEGNEVFIATDADQGLSRAQREVFDVVITDLNWLDQQGKIFPKGFELIERLHGTKPHLPIVLMTGDDETDTTIIKATNLGAYDYIAKPINIPELLETVTRAAESQRTMREPIEMGETRLTHDAIIGKSRAMQKVYKQIGLVARKPVTVLIRGETGTGKELVARAIYRNSDRVEQPFVVVHCAAIPEALLESELFGHEQGAFTGATAKRIGQFEQADKGTIFLDEIGDMSPSTQVKLLRVLQEKTIQRIGGRETIKIDVRVIAATHRNLEQAIQEKGFREDLYYRLNVALISLPPLRQRPEDIPELIKHFMRCHGADLGSPNPAIDADAMEHLCRQSWPGNVRELENVVRKALLAARGYPIRLEDARNALCPMPVTPPRSDQPLAAYVAELLEKAQRGELADVQTKLNEVVERELYGKAIRLAEGDQTKAAKWLGVSRPTMREKLTLYGLHPTRDGKPDPSES